MGDHRLADWEKEGEDDEVMEPAVHLFLYARCAIVANGRSYYERVLQNPSAFPKDLFFEALLNLPDKAYFRKTGKELEHLPKYI